MQPSLRKRRRIGAALRPEPQLAYDGLSDPILVRRAKDGDTHALEALCARHAPRVNRLAAHVLADPEDARDAAQDALAKLCMKIGQFRGEAAFSTWLHRLTLNACRDVARAPGGRRHDPLDEDVARRHRAAPEREAELSELRADLRDGLAGLPETRRPACSCSRMRSGSRSRRSRPRPGCPSGRRSATPTGARAAMREALEADVAT